MRIENITDFKKIENINKTLRNYNFLKNKLENVKNEDFTYIAITFPNDEFTKYCIEGDEGEKVRKIIMEYYSNKISELEKEILKL